MTVRRIVANIGAQDIAAAKRFYHDVLGLDVLMDHGWIATYGSEEKMKVQMSFASGGRLRHAGAGPLDRGRRCRCGARCHEDGRLRHRIRPGRRALGRAALLCARSVRQSWSTFSRIGDEVRKGGRAAWDAGGTAPPSVLPDISSARGEIGSFSPLRLPRLKMAKATRTSDLPLVGEMPGRTEGGVKDRRCKGFPFTPAFSLARRSLGV